MHTRILLVALILSAATLTGCKKEPAPENTLSTSTQGNQPIDPATTATLTGVINFDGPAPKPAVIDTGMDPACATKLNGPLVSDQITVTGGKLANVFVYVKSGAEKFAFEAPTTPVVVDQDGCRYKPHVVGLMAGQPIRFTNSDPTIHNIHPDPEHNAPWNKSQIAGGAPIDDAFRKPELMIPVKCNQHPWMRMFVNVTPHPLFAVSAADGTFTISGLPPGEYTIAAVHSRYGEKTMQITVGANDQKAADFTFTPSDSARKS